MNVDVALNKARRLQMLDNQNIYVVKKKYSRWSVGIENIDISILKSSLATFRTQDKKFYDRVSFKYGR